MDNKKIVAELVKLADVLLADSNRFQKAVNSIGYTLQTEVCGNLQKVYAQLASLCEDDSFMDMSEAEKKKIEGWAKDLESACKTLTKTCEEMAKEQEPKKEEKK